MKIQRPKIKVSEQTKKNIEEAVSAALVTTVLSGVTMVAASALSSITEARLPENLEVETDESQ